MQRNRRRLFPTVNRSYQYRFLAMIIIYNSIIVAFVGIFVFVPDILQMLDESLIFEVRAAAADRILVSHSRMWPALIALICIIGLHSLRFFNRFIGPLYRFRLAFEMMRDGDLGFRVKIRKTDLLHQEEQSINEMIEALAGKIRNMQLASNDSLKSLNELKEMLNEPSNNPKDSKELLLTHGQHLDTMADAARYFRLETSKEEPIGSGT
jgi:methyl-accepting chemotaxis protein